MWGAQEGTCRGGLAAALFGVLLVATCGAMLTSGCSAVAGESGGDEDGIDLDELFAPAQSAEIERAAADWPERDVAARGVELVHEDQLSHPFAPGWRSDVRVYAHDVNGVTHYGAVVVPTEQPDEKRPALLYLHGGDRGVTLDEVASALALSPDVRDGYIVVVPSFRSERLKAGDIEFRSEGPASPWDRDVDDTIALLNVALEATPAIDAERIVALGFSRGAAVGLLAAVRDPRVDGVASFFGPTDFLGSFARDVTSALLRDELPALPGVRTMNDILLRPLRSGELEIEDVRLDLIRRSPVYYVDRLPAVQIHHGLADRIVPPTEGQALADALAESGRTDYEAYFYDGGGHDPFSMNGSLDRLGIFLQRWTNPPG